MASSTYALVIFSGGLLILPTDRIYNNRSQKQSYDTELITKSDINKLKDKGYDGVVWDYANSVEISVFDSNQIKNTDNKAPTENKDIRYSARNFGLEEFNKESLNNIKMRGGVIVSDDNELDYHITKALSTNDKINLYLGAVSEETKDKIESELDTNIFIKPGQYTYSISYDDVRHISKHYSSNAEIIETVKILFGMLNEHDSIKEETLKGGQIRIILEKALPNADYLTVSIVSSKRRTLDLTTIYITKKNKSGDQLNQPDISNVNDVAQLESNPTNNSISITTSESQEKIFSTRNARYLELAKDPEKNRAELQSMVDEAVEAGENFGKAEEYSSFVESTADIKPDSPMTAGQEIAQELAEKIRNGENRKVFSIRNASGGTVTLTEENKKEINRIIEFLNTDKITDIDSILNIPFIKTYTENMLRIPETYTINSTERKEIRHKIFANIMLLGSYSGIDKNGKDMYNGNIATDKIADIVIGLPAAGKSSVLVNPLSELRLARVLDSDMVKEMIPEYNGGIGANAVHEESKNILDGLIKISVNMGENIVYPIVGGGSIAKLEEKIKLFKENGYTVYLHLNELPQKKSMARMLGRFLSTGRFIPTSVIIEAGDTPTVNYHVLKNRKDLVDGYSWYSNDVPKGERPVQREISENVRKFNGRLFQFSSGIRRMEKGTGGLYDEQIHKEQGEVDQEKIFSTRNRNIGIINNLTADDIQSDTEAEAVIRFQTLTNEIGNLEAEEEKLDAARRNETDPDRQKELDEEGYRLSEKISNLYAERSKLAGNSVMREIVNRVLGSNQKQRTKKSVSIEEENRILKKKLSEAERQMKASDKRTLSEADVQKLAGSLIRETQAKGIMRDDIKGDLNAIADEILKTP